MERSLAKMAAARFDLLVIGGGVNGSAIARDAALRGMRVALVEKRDFGWGTTARSTRLVHGGLRYLAHLDFALVREGLREREILLRTAPHLVRPMSFLTPVFDDTPTSFLALRLGMWLYDKLAWERSVPPHRTLSRAATLGEAPGIRPQGLRGALLYYDGQIAYPERLVAENLLQASEYGAQVANHAAVERLLVQGGKVGGAVVYDELASTPFEVRAELVVNAAGPWIDHLNDRWLPRYSEQLRLTKGIHLLTPRVSKHAVVLLAKRDGRLFFAVPWEGSSLIGTTDTDFTGDPDDVVADEDEVQYLIEESRRNFPGLRIDSVEYTTAGLRPLAAAPGRGATGSSVSAVSRRHRLVDHAADGADGLLSVIGGKITNQRRVAEEAVNWAAKRLGHASPCRTGTQPHYGGDLESWGQFEPEAVRRGVEQYGLTSACAQRLVRLYGSWFEAVLRPAGADRTLLRPVAPQSLLLGAEVMYAAQVEMARHTSDVLLRRTGLGLLPGQGRKEAPAVAELLGAVYGRTSDEVAHDLACYRDELAQMQSGIPRGERADDG